MQAVLRSVISSSGLDLADLLHQLLAVDHLDALALQREEDRRLDQVDAQRCAQQPPLLQLDADLASHVLGPAHRRREAAPHGRDAGPRALLAQPRVVELVVAGGRPEVPHDRLVLARQEREAGGLVGRPGADVGRRDVADVVHVEEQQRTHLGRRERRLRPRQPLLAEAVEIGPLLPVDGVEPVGLGELAHLRQSFRAAAATVSGVGTVRSSSTGENGTGTSIAPIRWTGASRW